MKIMLKFQEKKRERSKLHKGMNRYNEKIYSITIKIKAGELKYSL